MFHSAISQTLIFGQVLGLMPISGVTKKFTDLKVNWKSFKFIYSIAITIATFVFTGFHLYWMISNKKITLDNFMTLFVYFSNCITVIFFYKLATRWPKLIKCWKNVELESKAPGSCTLHHQMNLRMWLVLTTSFSKVQFN